MSAPVRGSSTPFSLPPFEPNAAPIPTNKSDSLPAGAFDNSTMHRPKIYSSHAVLGQTRNSRKSVKVGKTTKPSEPSFFLGVYSKYVESKLLEEFVEGKRPNDVQSVIKNCPDVSRERPLNRAVNMSLEANDDATVEVFAKIIRILVDGAPETLNGKGALARAVLEGRTSIVEALFSGAPIQFELENWLAHSQRNNQSEIARLIENEIKTRSEAQELANAVSRMKIGKSSWEMDTDD